MINLILLVQFAKFGALCFGGGYMIIPMLMQAFVIEQPVFSMDAFGNLLAVSQMTPGAVSINTATYVGFIQNGVSGALFASVGLVLPTLILSSIAILALNKWKDTKAMFGLLKGVRLAALAMVVMAIFIFFNMSVLSKAPTFNELYQLVKGNFLVDFKFDLFNLFVMLGCALTAWKTKMPIMGLIFLAGFLGLMRGLLGWF